MAVSKCRHDFLLMRQTVHMSVMASFQPPRCRPFQGFPAASNAPSFQSGSITGDGRSGMRRSPKFIGGEGGPNCVLCFQFRVICANVDDCNVILSFLKVLGVSYNSTNII
jgi:hypothetical protein